MSGQEGTPAPDQNDSNNNNNTTTTSNNNSGDDAGEDKICRDYQRGVCNRRGKCKFKHPAGMGTEVANQPLICRDFQNGKCDRSTCKYLHISNAEERIYLHTGQIPSAARGSFVRVYGHPRGEMTRAGPQDPICKDYLNRKCTRGGGCRFRHVMEDDSGGDGGYGYDDYPRKRRRESHDGNDQYLMEENESLRHKVADLQKQVSTLKATNEVLLEQNARYRNQATGSSGSHDSYSAGNHTSSRSSEYPSSGSYSSTSSTPQSYSTSYPSRESYGAGAYSGGQYTASKDAYNASKDSYNSTAYTSNTGYGTGYTKFEWETWNWSVLGMFFLRQNTFCITQLGYFE